MKTALSASYRRSAVQARSRAAAKTLLYRVVMVAITVVVAFSFVGNVGEALNIGIATNMVKTGTYYAYERVWDHISWGVIQHQALD